MFVTNRHGEKEAVYFDKILNRITSLAYGLHPLVDPTKVAQAVINGMYSGISTSELDDLAAQTCAYMAASHPDFSKLAARISVSNLHKNTESDFAHTIHKLRHYQDAQNRDASLIHKEVYEFVTHNAQALNQAINYDRDFQFDYFAFKTLERGYLLKMNNRIVERPQDMLMRVACGIHCGDVERAIESYELMSQKYFTHATPTLFNAGTVRPQMSSCFLVQMKDDSICGIFETLKSCALISKSAGGIGVAVHKIRAKGTYISGTNGRSNGLVPMLRVYNDTARYVDQGGGKRKGSFAIYLEPWHADVLEFLELKKNHGKEENRARDLFYALWIPDLFMERVEQDGDWTLMCPHVCPRLAETWGEEFEALYTQYEREKRGNKTIKAQQLWFSILQSQIETGTPFIVFKDTCNRRSNQKNLGTIQCSNLCTEIVQYTDPDEIAVCNLASIALPKFVVDGTRPPLGPNDAAADGAVGGGDERKMPYFDLDELYKITKIVVRNLNRVIDRNYYPVPEARVSNMRHRPVGVGVQGFADVLMRMKFPYESREAEKLNAEIFETIYFGAVEASCELAEKEGPYETFKGSPASEGVLQFDLFNEDRRKRKLSEAALCGKWDWESLKGRVREHGLRNSLLVAPMPTASTSQILGNCESFEPYNSNIYSRRVLSGEFFVVNPHLFDDLIRLGLWNEHTKQRLIAANGSVQNMMDIPSDLRELYKTTWEIRQKQVMNLAVGRMPFIDQSQSLNLHVLNPNFAKLSSMHFFGWKQGLKTGMYYLRTQAAADAIKFTITQSVLNQQPNAAKNFSSSTNQTSQGENLPPPPNAAENRLVYSSSKQRTTGETGASRRTAAGGAAHSIGSKVRAVEGVSEATQKPSTMSASLAPANENNNFQACPLRRRQQNLDEEDNSPCLACSG